MAKGYWVARVDVANEEAYARYRALNAVAFEKYGATFLVRGPAGKVVMGTPRKHNVVLEFKDYETALACYESPEYQAAKVFLDQVGEIDLVIVPGTAP
ncbi:MAG: hypothetical protein CTY25_02355 [Methylobacterium sp.]|nr:MAG: hypothetical protein CTY25_02355 [Methylobacterium sp.]